MTISRNIGTTTYMSRHWPTTGTLCEKRGSAHAQFGSASSLAGQSDRGGGRALEERSRGGSSTRMARESDCRHQYQKQQHSQIDSNLKRAIDCPLCRAACMASRPRPHLHEVKFGRNRHVVSSSRSSSSSSSLCFAANALLAALPYALKIMCAQGRASPYSCTNALALLNTQSASARRQHGVMRRAGSTG
jgi:hypothetical protein